MEPVKFPRNVTPVARADRVKRAKPREDRSGGSFAKHLHPDTEEHAEGDASAEDDREPAAAETHGCGGAGGVARRATRRRRSRSRKRSTFACSGGGAVDNSGEGPAWPDGKHCVGMS